MGVVCTHEAVEDAAFDRLALGGAFTLPGGHVLHHVDAGLLEEALHVLDGVGVSAEIVGRIGGILEGQEVRFALVERKEGGAGFIEGKRWFDAEAVAVEVRASVEVKDVQEMIGSIIASEVTGSGLEGSDDHHEEGVGTQAAFEGGIQVAHFEGIAKEDEDRAEAGEL